MLVNPFTGWRVSQGWREGSHAKPGGGPAIDYAMPTGTPLPAPIGGVVRTSGGGAAGNVVTLHLDDGRRIVLCHLSRFAATGRVVRGQVVGYSGATGRVSGPHLHTYGLHANGTRWDWTLDASPAGGGGVPFDPEEDDMNERQNMMLEAVYQELLPGQAGVKTAGKVAGLIAEGRNAAVDAAADARAAAVASQSLVTDFQQGQAGVRDAGRLFVMLGAKPAPVDTDMLVDALADRLTGVGGVTPALVRDVVREAFAEIFKGIES